MHQPRFSLRDLFYYWLVESMGDIIPRTSLLLLALRLLKMCFCASWAERPVLNPWLLAWKVASCAGSSAYFARHCQALSAMVGSQLHSTRTELVRCGQVRSQFWVWMARLALASDREFSLLMTVICCRTGLVMYGLIPWFTKQRIALNLPLGSSKLS